MPRAMSSVHPIVNATAAERQELATESSALIWRVAASNCCSPDR
jgi:hypothetical protein